MLILYDGTFDGLLTAIFEIYRLQLDDFEIASKTDNNSAFFQSLMQITTNKSKANRIKLALKKKTGDNLLPFLSFLFKEKENREDLVFRFIIGVFEAKWIEQVGANKKPLLFK